ncbi:transposase [Roseivirga pacifica]|uniref:transposase n=1 Tax=Roseivirga pacifica TaxID=1267423 RepID=UPI0020952CB2|nr:transposase [Roseivirga pacifica]MCO6359233.1 transposase [Roseivirga pacifica]MCO6365131.1 transposase [Roseivirga pacifica]MCO6372139.1 transposase [Roseivirga pacifica]MCO6375750.1 transposase [Roseivirga pacifica]MCO6379517.1 transposase [Roseivirga pacifica]
MIFSSDHIYHLYNRGNRNIPIFYQERNYAYFTDKVRQYILPFADILAYCLMPNHFHFLLVTKNIEGNELNDAIGIMLRSYTRAINKQENQTGSLFQAKTKAKELNKEEKLPLICFNYIHLNPLKAGLVNQLDNWKYSSFNAYSNNLNDHLINKSLAKEFIGITFEEYSESIYSFNPSIDIQNKLYL